MGACIKFNCKIVNLLPLTAISRLEYINFVAPLEFLNYHLIVFSSQIVVISYIHFLPVGIGSGVSFQFNNSQKFNIVTLYSTTR